MQVLNPVILMKKKNKKELVNSFHKTVKHTIKLESIPSMPSAAILYKSEGKNICSSCMHTGGLYILKSCLEPAHVHQS